jgi:pimeloyl-ACP methyl ester carboxylesterase
MGTQRIEGAGGVSLAVDVVGEGDAVVLLHGLGFSRTSWKSQVAMLRAAGRRVVVPDLRGFGDSDMPDEPYEITSLADDVEAVRAALSIDSFDLIGHSMGGMVAQAYALKHRERVRTLFLASTTSHNGRRAKAFALVMSELSRKGFDAAKADPERWPRIEQTIADVIPFTGPVMDLLRKLTLTAEPSRAFAWDAISRFTVLEDVKTISCPTTVMHGDADANIPFAAGRMLGEAIAVAKWIPVDGGRHNLPIEKAELFNRCISSHLAID